MNGVVTQYWSIIPGGIYQVLYEPITGVDRFNVLSIQECSSAEWNAESGVNTLNMSQHCPVMISNSKLFITTSLFQWGSLYPSVLGCLK